jgi:GNAT superfamily N-acetyltransferase
MVELVCPSHSDWHYWSSLDQHITQAEFEHKIDLARAFLIIESSQRVGVLRYNLFWDQIPFLTMIYLEEEQRGRGVGRAAMGLWEAMMVERGYTVVLTSTQIDEQAQHFYRALGYQVCGELELNLPPLVQPTELFLCKAVTIDSLQSAVNPSYYGTERG